MSLEGLCTCTYGPTSLIVEAFSVEEKPVAEKGLPPTSTAVSAEIEGYIVGGDIGDFNSKLAAAYAAMRQSGQNLKVTGLGGQVLYNLNAAVCLSNGPTCTWKAKLGSSPLRMDFSIKVTAEKQKDDGSGGGGNNTVEQFTIRVEYRPDDLRTITQTGKIKGVGAVQQFITTTMKAWQVAYAIPRWVTEEQYESTQDANQSDVSYTLKAIELAGDLPGNALGFAVEGDYARNEDRDEQMRMNVTHSYDLLVQGDIDQVLNTIRPTKETILREAVERTTIKEKRLRATFVVLRSGSGTALMNYSQSVSAEDGGQTYEQFKYPGADPVVAKQPKGVRKVQQRGYAVAEGVYLAPPTPIFPALLEPGEIEYEDVNQVEKKTTWRYVMYECTSPDKPADPFSAFVLKPEWLSRDKLKQTFIGTVAKK